MGSCISKCRSKKKKFKEDDCSHVQDKLVISQDHPMISPVPPNMATKIIPSERPLSPAPSSASTASFSSFSCSTDNTKCTIPSSVSSSSLSSSTTCSSSALNAKDKSFSNEFLWSCVKDNPRVIAGLNPQKGLEKIHHQNLDPSISLLASPVVSKVKQSVKERPLISTQKKRARATSPTLFRQKSFRKEQNSMSSAPNRGLRSPSPSRRFNGENHRSTISTNGTMTYKELHSSRRPMLSTGVKRESFRAPSVSPGRDSMIGHNFSARKKDAIFSQQISTKIDGVGNIRSSEEMDILMEDINNPLIALDCFIFL